MRRTLGVLIALPPFVVIAGCFLTTDRVDVMPAVVGYTAFALGGLICVLNAYLSWIRPRVHVARGGTLEDYKFVSGIPLFGTVLVLVGLACVPASLPLTLAALLLIANDTGGLHWFVIGTWGDRGLWDGATES